MAEACFSVRTVDPEQTQAVGAALGARARAGDVLALDGPLGSGKTQLAKGLARGLGVSGDEPVISPTFVLIREYSGRLRLFHLDAYRLSGARELADLGFDELREAGGVIVIEWAERVADALPPDAIRITLDYDDSPSRRTIGFRLPDARRLEELRAAVERAIAAGRPIGTDPAADPR